ncbi:MAG: surface-adhesin E family protein [Burkholderiaceae bacterium]
MDAIYEVGEFSGFVEYLDFESITVTDSGTLIVEEIKDLKEPRTTKSGKAYLSMRIRAEYDLAKHLRRTHLMQALNEDMGGGEVVVNDERFTEWKQILPRSNDELKLKALEKAEELGYW